MSGVLKSKRILSLATIVVIIEFLAVVLISSLSLLKWLVLLDMVLFGLSFIDFKAYKAMKSQMDIFYANSKIRNVDYLIIGESCNPNEIGVRSESFVQIRNPGLSEEGAYQILRRTHSILKEKGNVIIALERKNLESKKLGIIDTFFMHEITIKECRLEREAKLRKLIFFIHPSRSLRIISKNYKTGFNLWGGGTDLEDFCRERGMNYQLYVK